jgi:hypothetical protein
MQHVLLGLNTRACCNSFAGIATSLEFKGLVIADSKHKGLLPLVKGKALHNFEVGQQPMHCMHRKGPE